MPGVPGRGSRFAGVENRVLRRLAHDEASARVHSTSRERSLQQKRRVNGGAEWVPPLDRTACEPDLPLRVSRRSRSRATRHSRHDAGNGLRRPVPIPANQRAPKSNVFGLKRSHPCDRGLDLASWVTSFSSVMSEARCDAGSARRQLEKRPVGVPIGGGAAFVPGASQHLVIQTIPYRPSDHPSRSRIVSHRRRVVFPRVDRGTEPLI